MTTGKNLGDENDEKWDEQDIRIGKILRKPGVEVSDKSIKNYYQHLKTFLVMPCELKKMRSNCLSALC